MQTVGNSCLCAPERSDLSLQGSYHGLTQASFLGVSSQKSTEIALVTAEGDKVTISAKSSFLTEVASYDYRGRLQGAAAKAQGQALQASVENSLAIAVEGDLSEEELNDIKKLVAQIEKMSANFFSRPPENALAKTLRLGNLDSIASFAANLNYSRQLTVAQVVKEAVDGVVAASV